jgi:hypothetical protein
MSEISITKRSNLDILLDETISFDTAMHIISDRQMRGNPAAQSTIDTLMYSLRSGTPALKTPRRAAAPCRC